MAAAAPFEQSASEAVQDIAATSDLHSLGGILNRVREDLLTVQSYTQAYSVLREYVYNSSLESHRGDFICMLFPVFVNCYLEVVARTTSPSAEESREFFARFSGDFAECYAAEVDALRAVTTPQQAAESETARSFRERKYVVRISSHSLELLLGVLFDKGYAFIVNLVAQYIEPVITGSHPVMRPETVNGPSAQMQRAAERLVREHPNVHWGIPEDLKHVAGSSSGRGGFAVPTAGSVAAAGASSIFQAPKAEPMMITPQFPGAAVASVQEPVPTALQGRQPLEEGFERSLAEDAKNRVKLGPGLPSICFSTFFHVSDTLCTAQVSHEGGMIASGYSDSLIRVWGSPPPPNASARHPVQNATPGAKSPTSVLCGHSAAVYSLSFSPDSQFLISGGGEGAARLWTLESKQNIVCYKSHAPGEPVWSVDFSPVGCYFASGSHDRTARVWATNTPSPVRIMVGHTADVTCVRWHPNSAYLVTGSTDQCARLWDISTGGCVRLYAAHQKELTALAVHPGGKVLATASMDGTVALWDLLTSRRLRMFPAHGKAVYGLEWSCEGSLLASASADCAVKFWDTSDAAISSFQATPADQLSAGASPSPTLVKSFLTKDTPVHCLRFTRRNLLMACGPWPGDSPSSG